MLVYNLTSKPIIYRSKPVPPHGGSRDFPELDGGYLPDRDKKLETNKVLAFGQLPDWWNMEQLMKAAPSTSATTSEAVAATNTEAKSSKDWKEGKKR